MDFPAPRRGKARHPHLEYDARLELKGIREEIVNLFEKNNIACTNLHS